MTPATLHLVMPYATPANLAAFAAPLTDAMERWGITTPARQAAFLANVAAETASLSELIERSDGAAYEPPSALAADLGNTHAGDGALFIGRGTPMITGRSNYTACGLALGLPLLTNPALLEAPLNAAQAGGWFWSTRGLSPLADRDPSAFASICRIWNGGYNGIDERIACWVTARAALNVRP